MGLLWGGDAPDGAEVTLRSHVSHLRRRLAQTLPESAVVTGSTGYTLVTGDVWSTQTSSKSCSGQGQEALGLGRAEERDDVPARCAGALARTPVDRPDPRRRGGGRRGPAGGAAARLPRGAGRGRARPGTSSRRRRRGRVPGRRPSVPRGVRRPADARAVPLRPAGGRPGRLRRDAGAARRRAGARPRVGAPGAVAGHPPPGPVPGLRGGRGAGPAAAPDVRSPSRTRCWHPWPSRRKSGGSRGGDDCCRRRGARSATTAPGGSCSSPARRGSASPELVAGLVRTAVDEGAAVLVGRCDGTDAAYHPIADALALEPGRPDGPDRVADGVGTTAADPRCRRQRMSRSRSSVTATPASYAAMRALLSRMATEGPVLLVVEDGEGLDRASARLLRHVAGRLPAGTGVVVAYRDPPGGRHPALLELLGDVGLRALTDTIVLGPLDHSATAELVDQLVPGLGAGGCRPAVGAHRRQPVLRRRDGARPLRGTARARTAGRTARSPHPEAGRAHGPDPRGALGRRGPRS